MSRGAFQQIKGGMFLKLYSLGSFGHWVDLLLGCTMNMNRNDYLIKKKKHLSISYSIALSYPRYLRPL